MDLGLLLLEEGEELLRKALNQAVAEPVFYYEWGVSSESRGASKKACGCFKRGLELVLREPPRM